MTFLHFYPPVKITRYVSFLLPTDLFPWSFPFRGGLFPFLLLFPHYRFFFISTVVGHFSPPPFPSRRPLLMFGCLRFRGRPCPLSFAGRQGKSPFFFFPPPDPPLNPNVPRHPRIRVPPPPPPPNPPLAHGNYPRVPQMTVPRHTRLFQAVRAFPDSTSFFFPPCLFFFFQQRLNLCSPHSGHFCCLSTEWDLTSHRLHRFRKGGVRSSSQSSPPVARRKNKVSRVIRLSLRSFASQDFPFFPFFMRHPP